MNREKRHILYGLSEHAYSLKGLWLLALLYFGSLLSALALSLIAWRITHALDPDGSSYLASKPYPKFFDRARWLSVLLILPYLFWQCRALNARAMGFAAPAWPTIRRWFLGGIGMIVLVYGGSLAFAAVELKPESSLGSFLGNFDNALLAAIPVGLLEEIVFRGLVFRMFYTALKPLPALLASSVFFAALHFKASPGELSGLVPQEIGIAEGLQVAWETLAASVLHFDFTYLSAIFLVGVLLHQTFLLTNNLWSCVALHAGWVFTIKLAGGLFQTSETANAFTGSSRIVDGYWLLVVLIVFIAVFALRMKLPKRRSVEF